MERLEPLPPFTGGGDGIGEVDRYDHRDGGLVDAHVLGDDKSDGAGEGEHQPVIVHALSFDEVLDELGADRNGLGSEEAARRLQEVGPNRLPDAAKESLVVRILKHFNDVLIYILLVAVVVTALLGHWIDSGVIFGVVAINALIGFVQEGKAEQALEGIRKMLSLDAHVRRDGHWTHVDAGMLVPGDVVRLRSGDRVPADVRLIEVTNLQIEESALTGESVPTHKHSDPVHEDAGIGDRSSMAFSGTLVTSGRGLGVVTATGTDTEIGRINTMIGEVQTLATPLTRQMATFGKQLSVAIVVLATAVFVIGLVLHDFSVSELFLASIGLSVAAIPEGLPAILTITLAIGVQRMAGRNAITRRLNAVETLGSVTVICSDKTGTLTENEMTARRAVTRDGRYDVSGTGYSPDGEISLDDTPAALDAQADLAALVEVMAVANETEVVEEDGRWTVSGEPTEGALQTLAMKAGFNSSRYERLAVMPFESEHKLMATAAETPDDRRVLLVKGAPDSLLDRSVGELGPDGASQDLDRAWWERQIEELSGEGLRVLAAARRDHSATVGELSLDDVDELVFVGVVGIVDPPRPEAIKAIASCREAGIKVKMITGDHAGTACAIGREMGIGDGTSAVTGAELEAASDEELREIVRHNDVFARASPEHKLRLVTALQANDEVVAMTGDGVNDAPALKRADVGVAMGIKGTEATREAAGIVLADDNFASIGRAVEEGRTIYDNLRKSILFILPTNAAQSLVVVVAIAFGLQLPLTPTQILWVNMVTAVTLALALAFEPSEPDIMRRPPRAPGASILDRYFLWRIGLVGVLVGGATIAVFVLADSSEDGVAAARTMAVNTLVFGQICYLFSARFLHEASYPLSRLFANPIAWVAVGVLTVLQLGFVYLPFMNTMFETAPLGITGWIIPGVIGMGIFAVVEAEKAVTRSRARQ